MRHPISLTYGKGQGPRRVSGPFSSIVVSKPERVRLSFPGRASVRSFASEEGNIIDNHRTV